MSKAIKTQGNYMVYASAGERRAAFALESDRDLFLIAEELKAAFKLVIRDLEIAQEYESAALIGREAALASEAVLDKIWAMEGTNETTG